MSDDNSPSICGIKKLKGSSDYAIRKFATRNYLESKDWYKAVEYEGTELPATLKDTDRKARTTLCLLIEPECYAHVFNATTAKQVWQNLKTAYEDKGWGRRIALQRELWDCRLVNFPSMEKYITKVIFLTQQLSDIDAKVDDDWIISILLSGLTEVYNPLIMAVDNSGTKIRFDGNEFLCHRCWQQVQVEPLINVVDPVVIPAPLPPQLPPEIAEVLPVVPQIAGELARPGEVILEFTRSPNTSIRCLFFGCNGLGRRRIPAAVKNRLLLERKHYIPPDARVCNTHLESNDWGDVVVAPNATHRFNNDQVMEVLKMYQDAVRHANRLDFEKIEEMDADLLFYFTGRTLAEFQRIIQQTPSLQDCDMPNTALAILLTKLRTGDSNMRLSLLFRMSRRKLERLMKAARNAIDRDFVPLHLGWNHISRDEVIRRNLTLPNFLYGHQNAVADPDQRKAILICDGTYVRIQKSSNFLFQRNTYSLHKFYNLLKPFLFVCSDGYIVEVTGPHAATTSDATILESILNDDEHPIHMYLNDGDVFILDRGFRDAIDTLESHGYEAHMPESLTRGQTQYTTVQANKTRKITKCRWVVEIVNGRFKRDFKIFRQDFFNCAMSHMFRDFRIAAALMNAFHEPVADSFYTGFFIDRISERSNMDNSLGNFVIAKGLNRQNIAFQSISGDLPALTDFPRLSESELIIFALGTYQLKLASSYYSEHVRNGMYTIELYRRDTQRLSRALRVHGIVGVWLLRAKIQSRHRRVRTYKCYIAVDSNQQGLDAIKHYYCTCKSGMRTLGCCGHVMTVVWYLSWARYQPVILRPAVFLDNIISA
ncbi:gag-polypeptide of LTR copia-type domain-containing protein [Phthorimaea operculella]|nr:gag-polypeptide of LTR copia-type domain-containing protein [Phthorimaea operculella]